MAKAVGEEEIGSLKYFIEKANKSLGMLASPNISPVEGGSNDPNTYWVRVGYEAIAQSRIGYEAIAIEEDGRVLLFERFGEDCGKKTLEGFGSAGFDMESMEEAKKSIKLRYEIYDIIVKSRLSPKVNKIRRGNKALEELTWPVRGL